MKILFLVLIALAVFLTVGFTQLVKKIDKKNRLKGWRVWIPILFSAFFAFLLWQGAFFASREFWFWWAMIYGISIACYETIIKRITKKVK